MSGDAADIKDRQMVLRFHHLKQFTADITARLTDAVPQIGSWNEDASLERKKNKLREQGSWIFNFEISHMHLASSSGNFPLGLSILELASLR